MDVANGCRLLLVSVLSLALLGACGADKPEALVSSAKEYLAKGDSKAAVIQLKNALQQQEKNAEARFLLGQALVNTEAYPDADKELRKALELGYSERIVDPWLAQALLHRGEFADVVALGGKSEAADARGTAMLQSALGEAKLALGDRDAAREAFAAAQKADPKYAPALVGSARLKLLAADVEGALTDSTTATTLAPAYAEGWRVKGDVLAARRDADAAIAAYRKALELKPDFVAAHLSLVMTLLSNGKQEEATKALATFKQVAPKNPQATYLDGLLALQAKDYRKALESAQLYRGQNPNDMRGVLLAATANYQLHSFADAEADLKEVLGRVPNNLYARRMLVATYLAQGKSAKAIETLQPMMDYVETDAALLNAAGEAYLRNGQPALAARYFKKAEALQPTGTAQKTGLALTRLAQGDREEGLRELEAAAAADPDTRADLALIAASMQQRDYDKALAAIDKLEKKQPGNPLAANLRGIALLAKKDAAGARKSFEAALATDPKFLPAMANLAQLDIAEKKRADAEKRYQDFVAKNPNSSEAYLALAELRKSNNGSPEEIADLLNKAVAAAPTELRPRLALVDYYLRIKEPKKAVAAAQDALAAMPNRPEILGALGVAQQAAGDTQQALTMFNRLAQAVPESPAPLLRIAELQAAGKDFDAAAQTLSKALKLQPNLVAAQRGLIALDIGTDKVPQAITIAREVQKQRPTEAIGYVLEGDIHASKKDWAKAIQAYSAALKQAPGTEPATKLYAALWAAGKGADAERAEKEWLKAHPDDLGYEILVAQNATLRGEHVAAKKRYEAVLAKQPENAIVLNNLAWTAGQLNDPRAIEYAEKANKLAPNQPAIMDTLGMLLVERGDANRGVELLRKATELAPQTPAIRLNLAKSLIKTGQKDAARKELETLEKLGSTYAGQDEVGRLLKTL
jgi:putative PEP-CTERM system TPR-repeat lipoprotein